ncbi:hypothetical protein J2Z83_000388 [Virgibacillus natechei]|uniref:Alpha/beta hydrolase n=1 Tax=Virgibacillus natechei TaxID=1216297 RepID=A0ABS4IBH4_9BACI|nr:hypothetical protein [Virgibacillus natechei]MBP1968296.1 hypothetical protein [Virgibacillus natechei]UZD14440.1 hypothetical protein OLD84_08075 [Virgibacillus natechei]
MIKSEGKSRLYLAGWIVGFILLIWTSIYFYPVEITTGLDEFDRDSPLVIAHGVEIT